MNKIQQHRRAQPGPQGSQPAQDAHLSASSVLTLHGRVVLTLHGLSPVNLHGLPLETGVTGDLTEAKPTPEARV